VAAAQEPEPVVVKVSRFKHGIGDVFLSPEASRLLGIVYSPISENQPGIHLCDNCNKKSNCIGLQLLCKN